MNERIVIRTLLGTRQVALAQKCLKSLRACCSSPIQFVFHDDGSLTEEDTGQLQETFSGSHAIARRQADDQMAEILRLYPAAFQYRLRNSLGLKLLDIVLLSNEDIRFCDTDIIFFRPFEQMFEFPTLKAGGLFMHDHQNAYCISSLRSLFYRKGSFVRFLNTGIMCIRRNCYDLDHVDWLLRNLSLYTYGWGEQTCWAALSARWETYLWSPTQVQVIQSPADIGADLIAGHFVSPRHVRNLVDDFDREYEANLHLPPQRPEHVLARTCGRTEMAWSMLQHELKWCHSRLRRTLLPASRKAS